MPNALLVTRHALDRYRERVEDVPDRTIFERLSTPVFEHAADFGARAVVLPTGHRAVIKNHSVVTVLPKAEVHPDDRSDNS